MARANRHFLAGCVWHITHRCHKKSFLLKFARDRRRWCHWLYEARKRYGLRVLDYIVTRNHVHLLVRDAGRGEIASSMQLVAGRTAQEFNQRKSRRGAFWEDRYHATAVESETHLLSCIVYIDLNMVRTGVVTHPGDWRECGYREIQQSPQRYRIIDTAALLDLLNCRDSGELAATCRERVDSALGANQLARVPKWTESLAVGSESFVSKMKDQLLEKARRRSVSEGEEPFALHEPLSTYSNDSGVRIDLL